MSDRTGPVAVDPEREPVANTDEWEAADEKGAEPEWIALEEASAPTRSRWSNALLVPALIAALALAWTAAFVLARAPWPRSPSFAHVTDAVIAWSIPVTMLLIVWLIAIRTSRREIGRFSDRAAGLRTEAEALENKMLAINGELSIAREFLDRQARELDALGGVVVERLSGNASRLQRLIAENDAQVDRIESVGDSAVANMERLRADLPVIAGSARDAASQIGNAGRIAHDQLDELVTGFKRLNTFGQASEQHAERLREQIDATLNDFAATGQRIGGEIATRFETLAQRAGELRGLAETSERAAIERLRTNIERLDRMQDEGGERFDNQINLLERRLAEIAERQLRVEEDALGHANARLANFTEAIDSTIGSVSERIVTVAEAIERNGGRLEQIEIDAIGRSNERLGAFEGAIERLNDRHGEYLGVLRAGLETTSVELERLDVRLAAIARSGEETRDRIVDQTNEAQAGLTSEAGAIDMVAERVAQLTDSVVRLLELIRGAADQGSERLPAALDAAKTKIVGFAERVEQAHVMLSQAEQSGASLERYLIEANDRGGEAERRIDSMRSKLSDLGTDHASVLEPVFERFDELDAANDRLVGRTRNELLDAIAHTKAGVAETLASLEQEVTRAVDAVAGGIGERTAGAIHRELLERLEPLVAELDERIGSVNERSADSVSLLRDQLARLVELTTNLESRIERARETVEEPVDDDFVRRLALITERMNSAGIDLANALGNEPSDLDWAAYLRGDRGIFTRRAVRMLSDIEARRIADLYDADGDFRALVSRYIADFEAMLRTVLSTRDGNALSVTLLGSDLGKMYVALAQAIERLRG